MLTIEYDAIKAPAIPDGLARQEAINIINLYKEYPDKNHVWYSSEIMIVAFRECVQLGNISHEDIQFKYKDTLIPIDKNARCRYQDGFCSEFLDIISRLH